MSNNNSNNGNYNDTSTIPFFLRNYFPVRHVAPVLVGDMLGLTGTIVPNDSTYSIGSSDMPFNEMYLSGTINLSGNNAVGDFIKGPTGSLGFNADGSLYSSNGVTTNLINLMANNCWQKFIKNEFSIIKNLFGGMTHVIITCSCCGNKSHNFDFFQVLQLSIPDNATNINECLELFTKEEKMDKHNMIKCDFCGRYNKSIKQTKLWKLPKILIIQLKRFRMNNYGVITQKIINKIEYPINNFKINNNNNDVYDLYATNNHHSIGHFNSINFGHYTTNVINRFDNKWYTFDDSKELKELDEDNLVTKNAYMLFYIRKD